MNTGRLEANGVNGRLILAYESDYFENGGSKDYTQLIEMTRPQITGSLDLNMSYSITPTAVNEDYMTAWFRFEEVPELRPFPITVVSKVHLVEMVVTDRPLLPVSLVERLSFPPMNGFHRCIF